MIKRIIFNWRHRKLGRDLRKCFNPDITTLKTLLNKIHKETITPKEYETSINKNQIKWNIEKNEE